MIEIIDNRRRLPRKTISLPIILTMLHNELSCNGVISNLSRKGATIAHIENRTIQTSELFSMVCRCKGVEVALKKPSDIVLVGDVTWAQHKNGAIYIGVVFRELPDKAKAWLKTAIEQKSSSSSE